MNSFFGRRTMIWACVVALGAAAIPSTSGAAAKPDPTVKKAGFRLFARAGGSLRVNQVQCGLLSDGQICVDSLGSSTIPGSVWPKGTNNQYTFNSGISIAGIIGPEVAGWAGDTTGAFFFDGGGHLNGRQVEPIFNASDPADFNAWPAFARVPDGTDPGAAIFDPLLQGTVSASQGDVYFLTWDGNPTAINGRPHPMGIAVETRGLAWNFPAGNQDVLYFIYTLYNITSVNEADYALVRPALRSILLQKAQEFQTLNNAAFGISIPAGGYSLQKVFVDFAADQDVADANFNYATFNNFFNLAVTYMEKFQPLPGNTFDPGIHAPPFLPGPGFVGTKYLRSPLLPDGKEAGTVLAGQITNRGSFPDPVSTTQLYRYISGQLSPSAGDPQCNTGDPTITHLCFVNPQPSDARTFQSSGPLTLLPGGQVTIVVGYIFAAPLSTGKCATIPCPVTMSPNALLLAGVSAASQGVDAVDSAMGYRGIIATAGDTLKQTDFLVQKNSLLDKALVAQTVFDNKFLLPFAPTAPDFFTVPGDNKVSILWRPSPSEASGDAFFAIASQPTVTDSLGTRPNPLYDPSYRKNDVEGYRIYRGRTDSPNSLELVAQFDYAETSITDFRGTINPVEGCAPELGVGLGATPADTLCPVPFSIPAPGAAFTDSVVLPLVGNVVQVKIGGRVKLASGTALIVKADTAVTGGNSGFPKLSDTGVPFAFTDDGSGLLQAPRNNVRYFYSVTAFDINSFASGPSSLESQRVTKPVTPVRSAANVTTAELSSAAVGDDGVALDPTTPAFTIDAATGRFNGPPPPSGVAALKGVFAPLVPALLPALNLSATIDSVIPRAAECGAKGNFRGMCAEFFVTFQRDATVQSFRTIAAWPFWGSTGTATGETSATATEALGSFPVEPDAASAARFGIPAGGASFNAALGATLEENIQFSSQENQQARRLLSNISPGGSRWFDGANESVDDPTYSIRVGHLTGVDSIFVPLSHTDFDPVTPGPQIPGESTCMQVPSHFVSPMGRQADIELTWGAGGQVASIRDVTHHVDVPFHPVPQAGYGFFGDGNGNGKVDWADFAYTEGVEQAVKGLSTFCPAIDAAGATTLLTAQPTIGPTSHTIDPNPATPNELPSGFATTGTGFGLYINGQPFIFELTGGAPPADGTKWTLRMYSGVVRASTGAETTDPGGYTYIPALASAALPGVKVQFTVAQATAVTTPTSDNLKQVHTVPDPYYVTSAFEASTTDKIIKFVNLPTQAIIRIYSSSGVLVSILEHSSTTLGGDETWNVRNRNNQVVASGVYFYHIESGGARRVGRFTVVNFAQ